LRLRGTSFDEIARTVGIGKQVAQKAFTWALSIGQPTSIQDHYRSEPAELELEQSHLRRSL
jgi:hypothetical protein